jgi:hypothetical protein
LAARTPKKLSSYIPQPIRDLYKQYKQPIRGFLGWCGGLVLQIVTQNGGYEQVQNWNRHRWTTAIIAAAIPGVVAYIKSTPSDDELYDKVHRVKVKRASEGLEVTDPNGLALKKPDQPPSTP